VPFALFFFNEFRRKLQLKISLNGQNDRKCIKKLRSWAVIFISF